MVTSSQIFISFRVIINKLILKYQWSQRVQPHVAGMQSAARETPCVSSTTRKLVYTLLSRANSLSCSRMLQ